MATDCLRAFTDWPDDLIASNSAPNPAPVASKIVAWRPPENSETSPLVHKVQQSAFHVNWQFIYTEEEVGQHFLDNYGYFELIGPTGHFQSYQCCAFIGYRGPGLFYPAHHHASEELYFVLAGHALFESDGDCPATLSRPSCSTAMPLSPPPASETLPHWGDPSSVCSSGIRTDAPSHGPSHTLTSMVVTLSPC